jgi:hypothetical protein
MRYIIYATGLAIIATCLFGLIAGFVNCKPFAAAWDLTLLPRCTLDTITAFRYYCIPNIVTDAIILALPLPAVVKLQVGILTKLGLLLTFFTMSRYVHEFPVPISSLILLSGIVAAVLRLRSVLEADLFGDITYQTSLTIWTIIEPGVYLIASTIPTLRPLIGRFFKGANETILLAPRLTQYFRSSLHPRASTASLPAHPRRVLHKKSSGSLHEYYEPVGHSPMKGVGMDGHHWMQLQGLDRPAARSLDEESMVCAHAIIQERFSRERRLSDGLRLWSLQPAQMSPLRSSFVLTNKS